MIPFTPYTEEHKWIEDAYKGHSGAGNYYIFTPSMQANDAVSNHVLGMASALKANSNCVYVFSGQHTQDIKNVNLYSDFNLERIPKNSTAIVHFSIEDQFVEQLEKWPGKKVLYYHGITPPEFLEDHSPETAKFCKNGLDQLSRLTGFDGYFANSLFNLNELKNHIKDEAIQVDKAFAFPPTMSFERFSGQKRNPDDVISGKILYVGRIIPHKNIESTLKIFSRIQAKRTDATLHIVGNSRWSSYFNSLKAEIESMGLSDKVIFHHNISDEDLAEHYKTSSLFINMSRHEGFCLPIVEAISCDMPVLVNNAGAMPEVSGSEEYVVSENDFDQAADRALSWLSEGAKNSPVETFEHEYRLDRVQSKYKNFFQTIL